MSNTSNIETLKSDLISAKQRLWLKLCGTVVPLVIYDIFFQNTLMESVTGKAIRLFIVAYLIVFLVLVFINLFEIRKINKNIKNITN